MMSFIKEALTDETHEQQIQSSFVKEQQLLNGARAYSFVLDYQKERLSKQGFINENVVAQGHEIEEFLTILAKQKGLGPNVDFFSLAEIQEHAKKFLESQQPGSEAYEQRQKQEEENRSSSQMAGFFENNLNRMASGSISKKMSVRRPTKKIEGTVLNRNKNVVCLISNANQLIQNQMLSYISNSTVSMDILSYPFKWKVKRTNQDFKALRDYLLRKYPQTIVPALPRFNPRKRLTIKQLVKKQIYYQRFLTCVMKSQVLRSAEFLVDFLKEPSMDQFMLRAMGTTYEQGPKKLSEFTTLGGEIEINAKKQAKVFCEGFDKFIDTYSEINNFIAKKVKSMQGKAHDLADEYFAVGAEIQRFAGLLRPVDIPQITLLYDRLAQIILRNGDFILQSGEVLNTQLNGWFKYHREESGAFREAQHLREEAKKNFDIRYNTLMKQKAKLFKKQDILAWRVDREHQIEAERVKNDPVQAYQFILPDTTKEVEQLKDEVEYFTNQCYKEVKRVLMMDYDLARENFVDMGEMMMRMIYQMNINKTIKPYYDKFLPPCQIKFLSFYTNLNLVRKQYDERFQEEKRIGEEIPDPDESSSDDEYNQPLNEASLPPRNSIRLTSASYRQLQVDDDGKAQQLLVNGNSNINVDDEERKEGDNLA